VAAVLYEKAMIEDVELLRRYAAERSEEAFAELVRRHLGLVYGSALRRVNQNAALADEVAQSVFSTVAHEAEKLVGKVGDGAPLAGWLYVVTRNAAANVLRAEVRRVRREQEVFAMYEIETGGVNSAGEAEVWAQVRPELEAVMDELSVADRDAVLLRFFEGRAFGDIGSALRVSEDAARVRVGRALEKLRGLLAKRGIKSTAAALGGLLAGNAVVAAPVGMAASVTGAVLAGATAVVAAGSAAMGAGAAVTMGASEFGTGVLSFMTTTKLVTGLACIVAAASVGTLVWQNRRMDDLRVEAVSLREENARLSATALAGDAAKQRSDRSQRMAGSTASAASEKETLRGENTSAANSGEVKVAADPVKAVADRLVPVLLDPAYQDLSLKVHRTALPMTYGAFYRKQRLSTEQISRLEGLLTERKQNQIDLLVAAQTQGMSIDDPSLPRLNSTETDVALRALLGESGYGEFERYERTLSAREEVERVAAGVYYTETPLSLVQGEALAEIIAANTKAGPAQGLVALPGEVDWQAVYADAANVLSPAQLQAMRTLKEKAALDQKFLSLRMKLLKRQNAVSGRR
jgi:RNA polymerase sigma factor (sigma-70 family)